MNYTNLKEMYMESHHGFLARVSDSGDKEKIKQVIQILANTYTDNFWPLEMLEALLPGFGKTLEYWSSSGSLNIRKAQEGRCIQDTGHVEIIEKHFEYLPLYKQEVLHYSKDKHWLNKKTGDVLVLKSLMSCCSEGHNYPSAQNYESVLVFKANKTARLLGALSKEYCEKEVLLPGGAHFEVVSVDQQKKQIELVEI